MPHKKMFRGVDTDMNIGYHLPMPYTPANNFPKFGGYFACPLKAVLMGPVHCGIETDDSGGKFNVYEMIYRQVLKALPVGILLEDLITEDPEHMIIENDLIENAELGSDWMQDYGIVLPSGKVAVSKGVLKLGENDQQEDIERVRRLAKLCKMDIVELPVYFEGGNLFMGKKPNGEYFILTGEDTIKDTRKYLKSEKKAYPSRGWTKDRVIHHIASAFDVKPENVCVLPQLTYHIDLACRPLDYPNILVASDDEWESLINTTVQENTSLSDVQQDLLKSTLNNTNGIAGDPLLRKNTKESAQYDTLIETLKAFGLNPIEAPTPYYKLYETSVSFMNAIVQQHDDGQLTYLTNSTDSAVLNRSFEKWLKGKCPQVKEVIFVDGREEETPDALEHWSMLTNFLKTRAGGLHCLGMELPNFEAWA